MLHDNPKVTLAPNGQRLAALLLLMGGIVLLLIGGALYSDRFSARELLVTLPGTALLRQVYTIHAALPHRVVQSTQGLLAGVGLGLMLLAALLWLRRITLHLVGGLLGCLILLVLVAATALRVADPHDGVATFTKLPRRHQQAAIVSPKLPPAGGPHSPRWQNCGIYDAPVPVGQAVHALEHGAIWIAYHPGLAGAEVAALRDLTRQSPNRLLSPYPDLVAPIVVSSWGHQLLLDHTDDPRLPRFIARYERGPRTPEPGATCLGGEGEPLD